MEEARRRAVEKSGNDAGVNLTVVRGFAQTARAIGGAWCDLDVDNPTRKKAGLPKNLEEIHLALDELPLRPSLRIRTGGGIHAWWRFKEPWILEDDAERAKARRIVEGWQREIARQAGFTIDPTADLARVLRPPGTTNHKYGTLVVVDSSEDFLAFNPSELEELTSGGSFGDGRTNAAGSRAKSKESGDSSEESRLGRIGPYDLDVPAELIPAGSVTIDPATKPPYVKFELAQSMSAEFAATWGRHRPDLEDQSSSTFEMALASQAAHQRWAIQEIVDLLIAFRRDVSKESPKEELYYRLTVGKAIAFCPYELVRRSIKEAKQRKEASLIYAVAALFARLPLDGAEKLCNEAKEALGDELNKRTLQSMIAQARRSAPGRAPDPQDGRVTIDVDNDDAELNRRKALEALRLANEPPALFERSGRLVQVIEDERRRPRIAELTQREMKLHLAKVGRFVGPRGKPVKNKPQDLIDELLAVQDRRSIFPALRAVARLPFFRPDGSIFPEEGRYDVVAHDAVTRTLYVPFPGIIIPSVGAVPTYMDVARARELISEPLADFPFEDESSLANAYAAMLTPATRLALDSVVPLFVADAAQSQSGKGLLAQVICNASTGMDPETESPPPNEQEWKKTISAHIACGAQIVLIDNVVHPIRSSSLESMLTARDWSPRLLGTNTQLLSYQPTTIWFVAGNNLSVTGDLVNRCVWVRLDAKSARPDLRAGFRHGHDQELVRWVNEHLGELTWAILTIPRAWYAAGRPVPKDPMAVEALRFGAFTSWSRPLGGILSYAGIRGFLQNRDRYRRESDPEGESLEAFVAALYAHLGHLDGGFHASRLHELLRRTDEVSDLRATAPLDLLEILDADSTGNRACTRLGLLLRSLRGRRFSNGLRVERGSEDTKTHTVRWRVVREEP